ncbi:MAG: type II 3-dehydroquinate dehydratase [Bacteroidota bacterium]|nr:type II 3-dehydroquinate dehydratase [Bacteroidota bacterium]
MKKLIIINGPNLNLLGKREVDIYGNMSFDKYFIELQSKYKTFELFYFQSNHEGAIIDKIQEVGYTFDGIIINAGALTHTSIAIGDAIAAVTTPAIEVHISNVHAREEFRHHTCLGRSVKGVIAGFGLKSYDLAIQYFL